MKYPGLPRKLDKRIKLTLSDIKLIRKLYQEGDWSQQKLGKKFGVSKTTIRYWVSDDWVRQEINDKRYKRHTERMLDDDYAEKVRKRKRLDHYSLIKRTPELKKFKGKATYKWKKKKYHTDKAFREKTKRQARESYHRNQQPKHNKGL